MWIQGGVNNCDSFAIYYNSFENEEDTNGFSSVQMRIGIEKREESNKNWAYQAIKHRTRIRLA